MRRLVLRGVRQNNLKDVDLDLPLGKSIIVTGPSGSGKSSLAFDTVYAEGQRRFMQSLSTYARQFLQQFRAPLMEKMENIPPTIALEQLNPVRNSRATVGTTTEIYDYLRLLFEKIGIEHCSQCKIPMERSHLEVVVDQVAESFSQKSLVVGFGKKIPTKAGEAVAFLQEYMRNGFTRLIHKNEVGLVQDLLEKKNIRGKEVSFVVDRIRISEKSTKAIQSRIWEAIQGAWELGAGEANLFEERDRRYYPKKQIFRGLRCPKCGVASSPKTSTSFSFNSPLGACEKCNGFGNTLEVDEDLIVPDPRKSIAQGAIDPFTKPSLSHWQKKVLQYCKSARIDADLPYLELPAKHKKQIFSGGKGFKGVQGLFDMLQAEKYKMRIRVFVSRYVSPRVCSKCKGARLNDAALMVLVGGKSIAEICDMPLLECHTFLKMLSLPKREQQMVKDILRQLDRRMETLIIVGLGYLTTSRLSRSLSGGEYQRILLGTQLSQGLSDTLYVLDEPSIGLHPKDTQQLLKVLNKLLGQGNSLLVVEHDPEVIEWGQYIVDMGPGSGRRGGTVIFSGSQVRFDGADSKTSRAVKNWKGDCRRALKKTRDTTPSNRTIEIIGASGNNLKHVDVKVPLNRLVSITGVSGSGKSTLIVDTLYNALCKIFKGRGNKIAKFESISGFEFIHAVELIDQSPIGKSSRSNPITFIKAYDEIRTLFSQTREALAGKLTPGHFSFNVKGGRCDVCDGEGRIKVDMVFMEDVWVPCDTCKETRFQNKILKVRYQGKNINDVLNMTVDEALSFFGSVPSLRMKLAVLQEVGLGYIQLGQPGYTLSGGESQRLKIARELVSGGGVIRRAPSLFILDEPTTGLHFEEITKLLSVFRRLIDSGHSVVVIEHNLQVICDSDYLIDLGPDGGGNGGRVIAVGTPLQVATKKLAHTGLYLSGILKTS